MGTANLVSRATYWSRRPTFPMRTILGTSTQCVKG